MANGWTGGQYSVYRVLLAAALASHFGVAGWLAAAPLALGIWPVVTGWAILAGAVVLSFHGTSVAGYVAFALVALHQLTPDAPYGSWPARGRADPAADWRLPDFTSFVPRVLVGVVLVLELFGRQELLGALWLPLLLLCLDPAWLPPKRDESPAYLFYDGFCGLCHGAVRFVLAEDRDGAGFRFAPLSGDRFARLVQPAERESLPDSIVLAVPGGTWLVRSAATLEIAERLGGFWRALAAVGRLVPAAWLDSLYDWIAANRRHFVRAPDDVCPVVTPELRARFE